MAEHGFTTPQFDLHDRCRKAREYAGLSQTELAQRMKVGRSTVSNYETGATTHPMPVVLAAWASACGVPLEWLRYGIDDGPERPNASSRCTDQAPVAA